MGFKETTIFCLKDHSHGVEGNNQTLLKENSRGAEGNNQNRLEAEFPWG